jgi:hypothetical protein
MARGGHAHSGPPPVEGSRTSERKGYSLTALPSEGFDGDVPDLSVYLPAATARHLAIWAELWTTPQACAWSSEPWRLPVVADLVKWMVRSDAEDAPASTATSVRQLRDDLGLSSAGLRQNGWKIAEPKPVEAAADGPAEGATVTSIKDRLNRGSA